MSEVRCQFEVPEGVSPTACCDASIRECTTVRGAALITPAADDHVFVSATDGRCASIAKLPGKTDKPHMIPRKVVGKGKKSGRGKLPTTAVLNGRWECDGKFAESADSVGRFPQIPAVIPDVEGWNGENMVAVSLNPDFLARIVDAIGKPEGQTCVTLLMRRGINDTDTDNRVVESPIVVIGGKGIGLLMPATIDTVSAYIQRVKNFAAEYSETFGQPS